MFGSEQREAAAQQLNLQPASDKFQTSLGEPDQDRPDSIGIGKKSSAATAAKAERDHLEREAAGSANQDAAQKQSVPGGASLKQPGVQQRAQTHSSMAAQQQGSGRPEVGVAGRAGVERPGAPKASSYGAQQKEQNSSKPATAAGKHLQPSVGWPPWSAAVLNSAGGQLFPVSATCSELTLDNPVLH